MDCSICSAMPYNLRPPRNTICVACYEGAKSIIAMTNKIDDHKISGKYSNDPSVPNSSKLTTWGVPLASLTHLFPKDPGSNPGRYTLHTFASGWVVTARQLWG
ncbi:hypothetical protein HanPI659440_Chr14g0572111 [Helianthus annuus]|nr:hypothetical protein HanPI659440_Chr14g0572111 [Helianthus annuus]